jgi:hypothetical protein
MLKDDAKSVDPTDTEGEEAESADKRTLVSQNSCRVGGGKVEAEMLTKSEFRFVISFPLN